MQPYVDMSAQSTANHLLVAIYARGGTGPGRGPGHGPVRRSSRVGPVGPVGPVGSVRSARPGAKCANSVRSGPGGADRADRTSAIGSNINFIKNRFLEPKLLKFSSP